MKQDIVESATSTLTAGTCINGSTQEETTTGGVKLVNVVSIILTTLMGLITTNIQLGDFVAVSQYTWFFVIFLMVYVILRIPVIIAVILGMKLQYNDKLNKIKKETS